MDLISSTFHSLNEAYVALIGKLTKHGRSSKTRKGKEIVELDNVMFTIKHPSALTLPARRPSKQYTLSELDWYISGSYKVSDAVKLSTFWNKCSDDGKTVNSNYGALLFHERNNKGQTQFEHALECLKTNPESKKAVMVIYRDDHAYISKDNPCTMYLHYRIVNGRLNATTFMRSNDIYFGLPYDIPFFVFVQFCLLQELNNFYTESIVMGTYTHFCNTLHYYMEKEGSLLSSKNPYGGFNPSDWFGENYVKLSKVLRDRRAMSHAWKASEESTCSKKKVGAAVVDRRNRELLHASSSVTSKPCATCYRDDPEDKWFGDECPSVHAEMVCVLNLHKQLEWEDVIFYVTHGPCDACLKLLAFVGVKEVVYDVPYKTNYRHWPNINVRQIGK